MSIQELAKEARQSISEYCMNECNAYCCRKGFLEINEEEINLLAGNKRQQLEKDEFIKVLGDNKFSLNFTNNLGGCPALRGSKCSVHKDPLRPSTCDKYPIFINESKKEIRLSPRCFAVKENKLYPFVHDALKLGYKINKI